MRFLVLIVLLTGCASHRPGDFHYPHDFDDRRVPKLYLLDHSYGERVEIRAGEVLVWRGIFSPSGIDANLRAVGVPRSCHSRCTLRISGGIYSRTVTVDWANGKALILHFAKDKFHIRQEREPVLFL